MEQKRIQNAKSFLERFFSRLTTNTNKNMITYFYRGFRLSTTLLPIKGTRSWFKTLKNSWSMSSQNICNIWVQIKSMPIDSKTNDCEIRKTCKNFSFWIESAFAKVFTEFETYHESSDKIFVKMFWNWCDTLCYSNHYNDKFHFFTERSRYFLRFFKKVLKFCNR